MLLRRLELALGALTFLAAVAGVGYALFAPTGRWESREVRHDGTVVTRSGTTRLIDESLQPVTIVFLATFLLLAALVALGALAHARRGSGVGFSLVVVPSVALVACVILAIFSIGVYLAPATLLGIATTIVAALSAWREHFPQEPSAEAAIVADRRGG